MKNRTVMKFILSALFFVMLSSSLHASPTEKIILQQTSKFVLRDNPPEFAGLSGLVISNNGDKFVTISDKSDYFEGMIQRDTSGSISSIQITLSGHLKDSKGIPLNGRNLDSESIVKTPSAFYISFESNNRIMKHKHLYSPGEFLPKHEDFKNLLVNKGIEALAIDKDGKLFAIPEKPPRNYQNYPIYILRDGKWEVFSFFPAKGNFQVSDAAFMTDNSLILLERSYNWSVGFITRLRRLELSHEKILKPQDLLEKTSGASNYEGLSIWNNAAGETYLTLISDNNFLPLLTTEILEYKVIKTH